MVLQQRLVKNFLRDQYVIGHRDLIAGVFRVDENSGHRELRSGEKKGIPAGLCLKRDHGTDRYCVSIRYSFFYQALICSGRGAAFDQIRHRKLVRNGYRIDFCKRMSLTEISIGRLRSLDRLNAVYRGYRLYIVFRKQNRGDDKDILIILPVVILGNIDV